MIDATFKVSTQAKLGTDPEELMYIFTRSLNNGSNTSVPLNAVWINRWLSNQTHGQMTLGDIVWPSFGDIVKCIDRGHIAIGGFDDYINLRDNAGQKPYSWNAAHGIGHVLLIVGYDDVNQWVAVHDPLMALSKMPRWYSWIGFQAARFHDLIEVNGGAAGQGSILGGYTLGMPGLQVLLQIIWDFLATLLQYIGKTLAEYGKQ